MRRLVLESLCSVAGPGLWRWYQNWGENRDRCASGLDLEPERAKSRARAVRVLTPEGALILELVLALGSPSLPVPGLVLEVGAAL